MSPRPNPTNMADAFSLQGELALVTGGGTGIGLAIAKCLHLCGAKVILAGRRMDVLNEAVASIDDNCFAERIDLSDLDSLQTIESVIAEKYGFVSILVNNAGVTLKKPFEHSDMNEFDSVFDVHVRGALELSRHVISRQTEHGRGSVIFISSMTAYIGQPLVMGYTVSKTAINGVVRGLAAEFSGRGIRVNGVAPGWIDTELFRKATAGDIPRQQKIMSRIPIGELGNPADIGWACAYLASPAASYVTGQVLLVDGGGATGF